MERGLSATPENADQKGAIQRLQVDGQLGPRPRVTAHTITGVVLVICMKEMKQYLIDRSGKTLSSDEI